MANAKKKAAPERPLYWEMLEEEFSHESDPDGFTYRAKVPGGWLVALWAGEKIDQHGFGGGVTFVPDRGHKWRVKRRR